ncbi:ERD (early-responsive to dehydration stress) family protein [Hibiscus syriacus]|uniref:ERD (Early-responsive to dehydration stress) family protein n=1 Tax=Hibiscus syriacus TaxID=106335 RepID=A0A6A3AX09_HIBSY|nr:ERD (early-responsive to dehydration stress) family protein [Hibiscus syriacus]
MNEVMTAADASTMRGAGSALVASSPSSNLPPNNLPLISAFLALALAQLLKMALLQLLQVYRMGREDQLLQLRLSWHVLYVLPNSSFPCGDILDLLTPAGMGMLQTIPAAAGSPSFEFSFLMHSFFLLSMTWS